MKSKMYPLNKKTCNFYIVMWVSVFFCTSWFSHRKWWNMKRSRWRTNHPQVENPLKIPRFGCNKKHTSKRWAQKNSYKWDDQKKTTSIVTSIFQRVLFDSKGWCIGTPYHPFSTLWKIQESEYKPKQSHLFILGLFVAQGREYSTYFLRLFT